MSRRSFPSGPQFAGALLVAWTTQDDRELRVLVEQVPLAMLPQFDEWIRRQDWQFPPQYRFVEPNWLTPNRSRQLLTMPGLVCLLACHWKGVVRSAALPLLGQIGTPLTLSLLLVRVNDWAAPVREEARATLRARLPEVPLSDWLRVFPLVARLARDVRSPDPALVREIAERFLTGEGQHVLMAEYAELPQSTQRSLTQALLNHATSERPLPLLLLFAHDPQPVIRLAAVRQMPVSELTPFLTDRDGAVRLLALRRLLPTLTPEEAASQVSSALLDPQERVRLLAQYTLRQQGQDVRAAYLRLDPASLPEPQLRGWIAGLASEGQKADVTLIDPFLTHASSRVRLEALHAVGTLDPVEYRFDLAAGALDSSRVSRTTIRIMRQAGLLTSSGLLEHMLVRATTEPLKRRVLRLALNLERFAAIELLLRWREGWAYELSDEIDALLIQLLNGFGRTYYARPAADLLARLRGLADASSGLQQTLAAYSQHP